MKVYNETKENWLMETGQLADHFWSRFLGLMGRRTLAEGEGLIIVPTNAIHCFFMRFPIDVVYADRQHRVVAIDHDLKPWRIGKPRRAAHYVIELPSGRATAMNVEEGDRLRWDKVKTEEL